MKFNYGKEPSDHQARFVLDWFDVKDFGEDSWYFCIGGNKNVWFIEITRE